MIDAKMVAELRELSGAGMMDAKRALEESAGEIEKALEVLRKKGLAKAAKKSLERTASEGTLDTYIHANGKIGVLVEINCETDFVARNEKFRELAHSVALHIAATDPGYVRREEVPAEVIEKENRLAREELAASNKPPEIVEKIIAGKLDKFMSERCLLEQRYVKDDTKTVGELIAEISAILGEKIEVRRFTRYAIKH